MESDHLVFADDQLADDLVRRGRTVGNGWIAASGFAMAIGIGLWTTAVTLPTLALAALLLTVGIGARRRYWRDATRQVGDVAIQRARWRSVGMDTHEPRRDARPAGGDGTERARG